MEKTHTKDAAEALLRELPSVLGAFVREDVNGHPREIHLLVSPGPNVKMLAHDVQDLLQERLGIPVDQRVISIAQLAEDVLDFASDSTVSAFTESAAPERRLRFINVVSELREQRIRVRAQVALGDAVHEGEAVEVDAGSGRLRAAAVATLRAASQATAEEVRLELESVSVVRAFDREYVLVTILAGAAAFGRKLLHLVGAQPLEHDPEAAAAVASLKAINRVVAKVLP